MDKEKTDRMIKKRFKNISKDAKITYYRNPRECKHLAYEPINPEHVGFILGKRKYKHSNYIKIAKVNMCLTPLLFYSIINTLIVWFLYLITIIKPESILFTLLCSIAVVYIFMHIPIDKKEVVTSHVPLSCLSC